VTRIAIWNVAAEIVYFPGDPAMLAPNRDQPAGREAGMAAE